MNKVAIYGLTTYGSWFLYSKSDDYVHQQKLVHQLNLFHDECIKFYALNFED